MMGRWFLLLQSSPALCGGCHGVALSRGLYPTRRIVVAPRVEVKHPHEVACDAMRLGGPQSQKSGGGNCLLSR